MRAVKKQGTGLEKRFVQILLSNDFTGFEEQSADLPGTPDFTFRNSKLVVFVDSCFWHGCSSHHRKPKSNRAYWEPKIKTNVARDKRTDLLLRKLGWSVLRIWEHEINDPAALARRLNALRKRLARAKGSS